MLYPSVVLPATISLLASSDFEVILAGCCHQVLGVEKRQPSQKFTWRLRARPNQSFIPEGRTAAAHPPLLAPTYP